MEELKKLTLKDVLERSEKLFKENVAMTKIDGDPVTYAEFSERVRNVSLFLRGQDISKGDRVAILSENQVNWGIAFFSITSMGAIAVPILPDFHADAVHHILRHAECKALFVSKRLYEKIEEVKSEKLKNIILIDDFHLVLEKAKKDRLGEVVKEITKLTESALRKTEKKHTPAKIDENDIASIIYTSGTTGHSKGVMLTHKNIVWNAQAVINMVDLTDKERFLSILPLSHTMECTIGFVIPIMKGSCIYYFDKPPTPKLLMKAMAEVKPTIMISVPLIIEKIFKTRILPKLIGNSMSRGLYKLPPVRRKLHKLAGKKLMESFGGELKYFPIGGAAVAPDVERFMKEADFPYVIGYGLTETSPL
ncbi:MAG: AMP-binding protein, partial [candidate division KSB1 bacterium]|nr:AMP-binding protein [candidate division KSB1 bacterium]